MANVEITPGEREHVDYLADLFAVVLTIEQVEKANRRDLITEKQYSDTVRRLLEKYKSTVSHLEKSRNPYFTNVDEFLDRYCSRCPAARATIKEGPSGSAETNARFLARQSLECGQFFITLLDALRLQQTAVDAINPLLGDLLSGLNKLGLSKRDFYAKLQSWRKKLDAMQAADVLDDSSARQFAYDLEQGYNSLRAYLDEDSRK
ncbi:ESCRT-I complex subunit VPS28 [Angomonas deanei]|uniref:Vacuolar protein sorting-associated protein 28 homolog n=1 Tax=Angomonas deanei TaxID=59799 RepID=S9WKV2_9TRYP|nr:ESCRT-I complex subunit VPS28 [Angomonas deanei]EPY39736.1 ESCRT-I complex subunit VPS28 [Angomonas deanei]EPY41616.1 ESCRT-I complex subunit VPS28 [Angomonas deanei]CAD2213102.1 VPS28 protein, putative [Angomonas deanei]|eukprot:EPY32295.1 ESCRT-I complex subunit VPS28 [Angomonas deanei]